MANISREQKQIVKARILNAAKQLFSDKGYPAVTTRQIAKAAQVSESSIFTYFGSKDELFIAVVLPNDAPMATIVALTSPWESMTNVMRSHMAHIATIDRALLRQYNSILYRGDVGSFAPFRAAEAEHRERFVQSASMIIDYFQFDDPIGALETVLSIVSANIWIFALQSEMTFDSFLATLQRQLEFALKGRYSVDPAGNNAGKLMTVPAGANLSAQEIS